MACVYAPSATCYDHEALIKAVMQSTGGACRYARLQSKDLVVLGFENGYNPPTTCKVVGLQIPLVTHAEGAPTLKNFKLEGLPFGTNIEDVEKVLQQIGQVGYTSKDTFHGVQTVWNGNIHVGLWVTGGYPPEVEIAGKTYTLSDSKMPMEIGFSKEGRERIDKIRKDQQQKQQGKHQVKHQDKQTKATKHGGAGGNKTDDMPVDTPAPTSQQQTRNPDADMDDVTGGPSKKPKTDVKKD
jgi:hypothetical protein